VPKAAVSNRSKTVFLLDQLVGGHLHDQSNVEAGGLAPKTKEQPHALEYAPGTTMPSTDTTREPMSVTRDEERPMPDARRHITGRAEGE
jgi:hypothetical protein